MNIDSLIANINKKGSLHHWKVGCLQENSASSWIVDQFDSNSNDDFFLGI